MAGFEQEGQGVTPVNEAVADGAFTAVPAGSTNGTVLPGRPTGARGVVFYLPTGADVSYTIATAAPESAPSLVHTVDDTIGRLEEALGPETNIYVTAKTGSPFFRWL